MQNIYLRKVEGGLNKVIGIAAENLADPGTGCKLTVMPHACRSSARACEDGAWPHPLSPRSDRHGLSGIARAALNGVQYGLLLFLIASGLTLIFGVMGIINLAHGSLFMIGAYVAYLVARQCGIGVAGAAGGGRRRHCCSAFVLERGLFRYFYAREHLDQVLLTFALILLFEEARSLLVGNDFYSVPVPALFDFSVPITAGFSYSAYRFAVIAHLPGARRRCCSCGSSAPRWAPSSAPPPRSPRWSTCWASMQRGVYMTVFALGTALALVAGVLAAPLYSVYPNMGDGFLIISFVVVVIGGLGSVSGAFWSALRRSGSSTRSARPTCRRWPVSPSTC